MKVRCSPTIMVLALALLGWFPLGTSVRAANTHYPDNAEPLKAKPFTALPLGSVQARGWLLKQLELQRDGLTGHAEDVIPELTTANGWLGGPGESWEKGPYYLKGLIALGYTLRDETLKQRAQHWIEWTLQSQRPDGFYGPTNTDWWPRMVMNYALRDYAEATGDPRVLPFLTRYYRCMTIQLPYRPLNDWGKARAGDEIDTILWLHQRTRNEFLIPLAERLRNEAYDWIRICQSNAFQWYGPDFHPKHNVNIPQALKFPAVCYQLTGQDEEANALFVGRQQLLRDHGLSPGLQSGTEFLGGTSPGQGLEFCSIVEQMLTDATALRILGRAELGDQLERMAFNALPAAWTRDLKAFQYYTVPNEVIARRGGQGFLQDYEDELLPGPHSGCHCCCYNVHMGWPKLAQNCWAATADNGLAVLAYVPSEVRAKVGEGVEITVTEETNYPFEEQIQLKVSTPRAVAFPLKLRLPAWCGAPVVKINGRRQLGAKPGTFLSLARTWANGDTVTLDLPMALRVVRGVHNSAHVEYGPLLFALRMGEQWSVATPEPHGFSEYEVAPTSPWNYALAVDWKKPAATLKVERKPMTANPFADPPLLITASARKLPDWGLAWHGRMAFDPPYSPVVSTEPAETVTLAPFGTLKLRITDFPWLGRPEAAPRTFTDNFDHGDAVGWVTYGGGWFVREGQFQTASSAASGPWPGLKAVATGTRFGDFTYEADVAVGASGNAGLIFRVAKPSIGANAYQGYYAGIDAAAGRIELGLADGQNYRMLGRADLTVEADKAVRLKIVARGLDLKVFADDMNKPKLAVTDGTYTTGAIGLRNYNPQPDQTLAVFDNLSVRAESK